MLKPYVIPSVEIFKADLQNSYLQVVSFADKDVINTDNSLGEPDPDKGGAVKEENFWTEE